MPRDQATPIRRGPGCLWAKAGCRLGVESKRVDAFENMSDEELRQYVYGNKESEQ